MENYLKDLPDQFSYDELEKIVRKDAEANTTNNDMGMENHFYTRDSKGFKKNGKGIKKITTSSSPPSTMICSWSSINLLSRMSMYSLLFSRLTRSGWSTQGSVRKCTNMLLKKIRYQLESQGFTNIADFSKKGGDPYFVKDTIHWLVGLVSFLIRLSIPS